MDAISSGASPNRDDAITRLRITMHKSSGHHTDDATKHKGVPHVAIIEPHPAIQRWDTHPIAVISNPGDHLLKNAARGQTARRNVGQIRGRNTKDIRGRNWLGPQTGTNHITDAATNPCRSTAIRLNGTWVVVGLHLEAHRVLVVERHYP